MNKVNESGKVTFGQAWKDFWKGYVDFKGTSARAGFWCLHSTHNQHHLVKQP